MTGQDAEFDQVAQRYARRTGPERYSMLRPEVWQLVHERERAILWGLSRRGWFDLSGRRLVDVGCGAGEGLMAFIRMGFEPGRLTGCEMLPERLSLARQRLPAELTLWGGDAVDAPIEPGSQSLVYQGTVFSSILSDDHQLRLARAMWAWLQPGGAILWYDFTMDNPRNRDVRGVPASRVRQLFPEGTLHWQRITLAPPLARIACRWHPSLYPLLNSIRWLRTHGLAWIEKS